MVMLTRLLTQCLRHCIFCLRGAYYVDCPYAIGLRQLTRLRVLLAQASYDTTASKVLEDAQLWLQDAKRLTSFS